MFLNDIKKCTNIYDIMLACYKQIKNETIKNHLIHYNPSDYNHITSAVFQYVEETETSNIDAIKNLIQNIENLYFKKSFEFGEFYSIIQSIDSRCKYRENEIFSKEFNKHAGINNDKSHCVSIFPILKDTVLYVFDERLKKYEKSFGKGSRGLRKREKLNDGNINDFLENYTIIKDEPFKVISYTLSECYEFLKNSPNMFSVNIVPLTNIPTTQIFEYESQGSTTEIKSINAEYKSQILEIYKNKLQKTNQNDLIVFPELFLTSIDLNEIYETIKDTKYDKNQIFILGSKCELGSNKCIVMTSNGTFLFEQHKKTPYKKNDKYENLENSDNIINVIDIPHIGRIGVAICKDIFNSDIKNYFKLLSVDIIIVVAYSPSLNMKGESEELAKFNWCISIMCNACSAVTDKNDTNNKVGYITFPAKKDTYSDYYTEFYTNEHCNQCKACNGQTLNIIYNEIGQYSNKLSIKFEKTIEKADSM